ncbi:MAG: hypothetical protein AAF614_04430 [Chloroflexota bacterium]
MFKDIFPFVFLVIGLLILTSVVEQDSTYGKELEEQGLFQPLSQDTVEQKYLFAGALTVERTRLVDVDFDQLDLTTEQLHLNLFDDVVITAVRDHTIPNASGDGLTWMGKAEHMPSSQVILVSQGNAFVGTILLTDSAENGREATTRTYEVLPIPGGGHRVQERQHHLPTNQRHNSAGDISDSPIPSPTAPNITTLESSSAMPKRNNDSLH